VVLGFRNNGLEGLETFGNLRNRRFGRKNLRGFHAVLLTAGFSLAGPHREQNPLLHLISRRRIIIAQTYHV